MLKLVKGSSNPVGSGMGAAFAPVKTSQPLSTAVIELLGEILPPADHHLPLVYHQPRQPPTFVRRVVLSVTPTRGCYTALKSSHQSLLFLHRPWQLDRRQLASSAWVIASHQRLDELLTTGHNEPLMKKLCHDASGVSKVSFEDTTLSMATIVGYKQDPTRRMGLVARIPPRSTAHWLQLLEGEFGTFECTHPARDEMVTVQSPLYLACMNAFEPAIIDRVIEAAKSLGKGVRTVAANDLSEHLASEDAVAGDGIAIDPSRILYLTGQSRPAGAEHAAKLGMPVVCVGHRSCELWAVRHLAQVLQDAFPGLETVVVDEPEELQEKGQGQKGIGVEGKPKLP